MGLPKFELYDIGEVESEKVPSGTGPNAVNWYVNRALYYAAGLESLKVKAAEFRVAAESIDSDAAVPFEGTHAAKVTVAKPSATLTFERDSKILGIPGITRQRINRCSEQVRKWDSKLARAEFSRVELNKISETNYSARSVRVKGDK